MAKLTTFNELEALAATARREYFGPTSANPYLAVEISGKAGGLAEWLKDLPCPVIGIGDGDLAPACDVVLDNDAKLPLLAKNIEKAPLATMILVQHLRFTELLSIQFSLIAESFAYATVQKGPEFANWLANREPEPPKKAAAPTPLSVTTNNNTLELVMNDPDNLNAVGTEMRDALCEALDMALTDTSLDKIKLTGAGRVFSTGGEVSEFGEVIDPATAHWIRTLRLPAWRLARLCDNLHIHVNGAAVGAGAEMAAFGTHISASPKAWFQLPELKYGLIPGAGGTASIPYRIGRQRTAYMALSMEKIKAKTALDWGLIDEMID
ncbi:MAG: enoyl-CoA hydratase/isomerase family protein [Acidimicrobiales bacterium]|nr:enoyl-CoA hydratase/isomerase family protein [Hyphomonadaceae bacterium]RZV36019.1 MAG: enoyl-CoA hydratase/isomerase family protein [Acidimicrobiales bacterium]